MSAVVPGVRPPRARLGAAGPAAIVLTGLLAGAVLGTWLSEVPLGGSSELWIAYHQAVTPAYTRAVPPLGGLALIAALERWPRPGRTRATGDSPSVRSRACSSASSSPSPCTSRSTPRSRRGNRRRRRQTGIKSSSGGWRPMRFAPSPRSLDSCCSLSSVQGDGTCADAQALRPTPPPPEGRPTAEPEGDHNDPVTTASRAITA